MRITILTLLAFAIILSAVEPTASSSPTPGIINTEGTITVINLSISAIELRITDKEGRNATTIVLTLTTTTKITNGGKSATPNDLKVGSIAKVSYNVYVGDVSGGTALTIDEKPKKGK